MLMTSDDSDVSDLAMEVLFMYCTPSSSMAFYGGETDWKDAIEVMIMSSCIKLSDVYDVGLRCVSLLLAVVYAVLPIAATAHVLFCIVGS